MKQRRASNMELLRIVSMLLIVIHHSTNRGLESVDLESNLFNFFGGVGVNSFVFISGYYMVHSRVTLSKMLKMWGVVLFYSAGLYLLMQACVEGGRDWGMGALSSYLQPIRTGKYWFVTVYVALMLFSPILNSYILSISRARMLAALAFLAIVLMGVPTGWQWWGGRLFWFGFLYGVAAFIRLHGAGLLERSSGKWFVLAIMLALVELWAVWFRWSSGTDLFGDSGKGMFALCFDRNSALVLLCSLFLFLGFASCRLGCVRIVNVMSACAFGVYLIHDHPEMKPILWNGLFHVKSMADSTLLLPYCIGISFVIYIVCSLVELLRQLTFGRLYSWAEPRYVLPFLGWGRNRLRACFVRMARHL